MPNYDMTYCVRNCANHKCVRNYDFAPEGFAVSLANFEDCPSFIKDGGEDNDSEDTETNTGRNA